MTNREIELARIRRKFRAATLRGDLEAREKLNRKFLSLMPPDYSQVHDPNEKVSRRILQYELDMQTFEGEPDE